MTADRYALDLDALAKALREQVPRAHCANVECNAVLRRAKHEGLCDACLEKRRAGTVGIAAVACLRCGGPISGNCTTGICGKCREALRKTRLVLSESSAALYAREYRKRRAQRILAW